MALPIEGMPLDQLAPPPGGSPGSGPSIPKEGLSLDEAMKPPVQAPISYGKPANLAARLNEGIAGILGAPADLGAWLVAPQAWSKLDEGERDKFRQENPKQAAVFDFLKEVSDHPSLGKEWWKDAMRSTGKLEIPGLGKVAPIKTDEIQPTNLGEKMAGAAGSMISDMAIPGLGAEAILARSWKRGEATQKVMAGIIDGTAATGALDIIKGGGFAGNIAMGVGAGIGGTLAEDKAPDALKPTAKMAGELAGGGMAAAAENTGRAAYNAVRQTLSRVLEPFNMTAARQITDAAANPGQVRTDLANDAGAETVPGSRPTTFQATGDLGVGQEERSASSSNPVPFIDRQVEQNAARMRALEGVADPEADSAAVSTYVRSRLASITDEHAAKVGQAIGDLQDRLYTGGQRLNEAEHGELLRTGLDDLHQQAREATDKLWRAIDPDMDTPVNIKPLQKYLDQVEASIPRTAKPPTGEERAILDVVGGLGDTTTFEEMVALRSRLTTGIMDARRAGDPQTLRRLSQMLRGVDDTLAYTAGDVAKDPSKRSEVMKRLVEEADTFMKQQEEKASGRTSQVAQAGDVVQPGRAAGAADAELGTIGQGTIPPTSGAEVTRGGGPAAVQGGAGVQEAPVTEQWARTASEDNRQTVLTKEQAQGAPAVFGYVKKGDSPEGYIFVSRSEKKVKELAGVDAEIIPFRLKPGATIYPDMTAKPGAVTSTGRDTLLRGNKGGSLGVVHLDDLELAGGIERGVSPEIAQRYQEARSATREMKGTFTRGPVGQVLRPDQERGSFRMSASNVASKLFDSPERLDAFVKAAGDSPDLLKSMEDYAAFSMQGAAVRDGVISQPRLAKWATDHSYALEQFPDLAAKFGNVRSAQASLDAAIQNQKAALREFQTDAVTKLLDGRRPEEVVGGLIKRPEEFSSLVETAKSDPAALAGLKRAVVDHLMEVGRGTSAKESGTSGINQINGATIQKFVSNNEEALGRLFSPEEMTTLRAVADDLQVSARTAPAAAGNEQPRSVFRTLISEYGGRVLGAAVGAAGGHYGAGMAGGAAGTAAGAVAGAVLDRALTYRASRISDAVTDMLLNPKIAEEWLRKIPAETRPEAWGSRFDRRVGALELEEVRREMDRDAKRPNLLSEGDKVGAAAGREDDLDKQVTGPRAAAIEKPAIGTPAAQVGAVAGKALDREYPGDEDLKLAKLYDRAYGSANSGFYDNPDQRIRTIARELAPDIVNDRRFKDVPWQKVDRSTADQLYLGSMAASRSAVAALGFDPSKFVLSPKGEGEMTLAGAYSPKDDAAWLDMSHPAAMVHESIHRGLKLLKDKGLLAKDPEESSNDKPYISHRGEEMLVRSIMIRISGEVEKGLGSDGDLEVEEAQKLLSGANGSKWRALIDKVEGIAARSRQQGRLRGPV